MILSRSLQKAQPAIRNSLSRTPRSTHPLANPRNTYPVRRPRIILGPILPDRHLAPRQLLLLHNQIVLILLGTFHPKLQRQQLFSLALSMAISKSPPRTNISPLKAFQGQYDSRAKYRPAPMGTRKTSTLLSKVSPAKWAISGWRSQVPLRGSPTTKRTTSHPCVTKQKSRFRQA